MARRRRQDESGETMSIPAAGKKYFGLGKSASYAAAKSGDLPTIRGRVPIRAMEALLNDATEKELRRANKSQVPRHDTSEATA